MNIHASGHALPSRAGSACEDAWCLRQRGTTLVAALADGVGSSREGGAAAHRAVEMLVDYYLARPRAWSPRRALAEFTAQINRHLHSESLERHGQPELACTLSAVVIEGGRLYGCNVGDSPVLHWRRGRIQILSTAHTVAQPELAHVLTQALGLAATVDPQFFELELADGDLVFLCSDGVSTPLPEARLAELLSRRPTARAIVSAAHAVSEENPELADDASAIVLDVVERGHSAEASRQRLDVPRHLRAGDVYGGHRLERPLAPSERVWLAVAENDSSTRVVLKFPATDAAEVEPMRDAFIREAWNATRLSSADLVRAWLPESDTLRCYAMEFVDAPTLATVLRAGRLGVEEARELGAFLLRVGQFLLQHDLAHGDIKPDNILVLRSPGSIRFRLLDLGSAAELFSVTSRAGTPSYLAPERFRGAALSERTEIFAIGITLYEALTGTYPYGEIERFQTPRFDTQPRRPTRLNAVVPDWLDSIVMRAIELDADRRYQNFSEMAYALAHPAQVTPHHRKDSPLLERNPLLFYKLLCLLLLGVIVALLYLLAGHA
ncbi:MAG: bifunctional protein-serine/threonine kinase/phosphatase [Verrucomicrobiota bacterium]